MAFTLLKRKGNVVLNGGSYLQQISMQVVQTLPIVNNQLDWCLLNVILANG